MNSHYLYATALSIGLSIPGMGCAGGDSASAAASNAANTDVGVTVEALSDGAETLTTCTRQVFKAVDSQSSSTGLEYAWNLQAPAGAVYEFAPADGEFSFMARTAGEYHVHLTVCDPLSTMGSTCSSSDSVVVVTLGTDANRNGVGDACEAIVTASIANCAGRLCGPDPISGESCGICSQGQECDLAGQCADACIPNCAGRSCGSDGCGGTCGSCSTGEICGSGAQCIPAPAPSCQGRVCGKDPSDGTDCGTCAAGSTCQDDGRCVANRKGRVVTIVMALTNDRLAYRDPLFRERTRLVEQSVRWVSGGLAKPKVLVVADNLAGSVSAREPKMIRTLLRWRRLAADFVVEPRDGLTLDQLRGYDVIWFSNPAAPLDQVKSVQALTSFVQKGGGVVLQGDDITQKTYMEPLTRLHYLSDGEYSCGRHIARNRFDSYEIQFAQTVHPVIAGLRGDVLYYGADIDVSALIADSRATVLAWAQVAGRMHGCGGSTCDPQPVVVAYDMNR